MLKVPRRQKGNAVDRRQRNVQGVTRFGFRYGMRANQGFSERLGGISRSKNINVRDDLKPLASSVTIAITTFGMHEVGHE
jgi:hypothetical protein